MRTGLPVVKVALDESGSCALGTLLTSIIMQGRCINIL